MKTLAICALLLAAGCGQPKLTQKQADRLALQLIEAHANLIQTNWDVHIIATERTNK